MLEQHAVRLRGLRDLLVCFLQLTLCVLCLSWRIRRVYITHAAAVQDRFTLIILPQVITAGRSRSQQRMLSYSDFGCWVYYSSPHTD
jgi:hypothetical protein